MQGVKLSEAKANRILARLPAEEYQRLAPHLEWVDLDLGTVLFKPGQERHFAYFPLSCVVAFLFEIEGGKSTKVGMIGRDGMVGLTQILEGKSNHTRVIVQSAGKALRIRTENLKREFYRGSQLMSELLRYVQFYITQLSQLSVCHNHHRLDQQLARWILQTLDRLDGNQITATQELLSLLLGARRQGLSQALAQFQSLGLIERERGKFMVPKPKQLEQHACECYSVIKREQARLFPRVTHIQAQNQDASGVTYANHQSSALQSSYLALRVQALELALSGSDLAWWDVNLRTGNNEVVGCDVWTGMLGYAPGEFHPTAQQWDDMVHPKDRAEREAARLAHLTGVKPRYECEYRIAHKDGHWVWIAARGKVVVFDEDGHPLRLVGTNQDITARKADAMALENLVRTDYLTETSSRRQFFEMAEREFASARRHNSPLSLIAIDLDHFKRINDTYGHEAGDRVLKAFADTVKGFLRITDVFGRTGGEEFCLLMPHTDAAGALVLADRVLKAVLAQPVQVGELTIAYSVSLGVCTLKPQDSDLASLMRQADGALYRAKIMGRNRMVVAQD